MSTQCIRTERYKLIEHRTTGEFEMFDLAADPFELVNLYGQPEIADTQATLQEKLYNWASTHDATTITTSKSDE